MFLRLHPNELTDQGSCPRHIVGSLHNAPPIRKNGERDSSRITKPEPYQVRRKVNGTHAPQPIGSPTFSNGCSPVSSDQPAEVDHQGAVGRRATRRVVPAAADRHLQPFSAGEAEGEGDIGGAHAPDDHCGAAVDVPVPQHLGPGLEVR